MSSRKKKVPTAASKETKGCGKKRAAVDEEKEEEENGTPASTTLSVDSSSSSSSSSLSSSSSSDAAQVKRLKSTVSDMSKDLTCAITQELMVDPVIAVDGNTYERQEITQWLASNDTSPKTNLPLEHKTTIPNLAVKQQIERLVGSGELDDDVYAAYQERKEAL